MKLSKWRRRTVLDPQSCPWVGNIEPIVSSRSHCFECVTSRAGRQTVPGDSWVIARLNKLLEKLSTFPNILTLVFTTASKGANPHTRSIYEKNYLRYSVFFRYSWDKQLSNLLHLRTLCSDFWKCHIVNPKITFIFSVTYKFGYALSIVHKYSDYNTMNPIITFTFPVT